jgi:hypothetical protein
MSESKEIITISVSGIKRNAAPYQQAHTRHFACRERSALSPSLPSMIPVSAIPVRLGPAAIARKASENIFRGTCSLLGSPVDRAMISIDVHGMAKANMK